MLEINKTAPAFSLENDQGQLVSLDQFRGQKVVLYFYPKDDTPGCTTEACGLRDVYDRIREKGAVVIGISPDPPGKHDRFRKKYGLPFPLLSDPDHQVLEAYDAWAEKKMYGKSFMGVVRSTVIIDEEGVVRVLFPKVKPADHPREILEALEG